MEMEQVFSAIANISAVRESTANSLLSGGMALYQKKRYKEAISAFKQATAYKPDMLDAYNLMANAYTQLKDNQGAIRAYKISVALDKTQGNVHMAMGNIYMADQNYGEAEKSLKLAAKADPTSALPVYTLGMMYQQLGRDGEAEAMFKKSVKLSPRDGNPHYALGALYNKQGHYDQAVSELQKALELKPNFSLANSELGKAYVALGQEELAQRQADALKEKNTSLYKELAGLLDKPKILSATADKSTFNFSLGANTSLIALDPSLIDPGASKDFTMQIQFDREMDYSSVVNIANWNLSKARGGTAGLYDNGLYRPTDVLVPFLPKNVMYDPLKMQATVTFSLSQNDTGTATIDPAHVVFKFNGKDVEGKQMDKNADQYNGSSEIF